MPQRYITGRRSTSGRRSLRTGAGNAARPRSDEVIVEVKATGMCHADIVVRDQHLPVPLPLVLGHEGAGVVVEKGSGRSQPGHR